MSVGDQYGESVELYVEHNRGALDAVPSDRDMLDAFIERVFEPTGLVLDVGCGPGHIAKHLADAGQTVAGYDISPPMIRWAATHYPDITFSVAGIEALPHAPKTISGIVARYSVIHTDPEMLRHAFEHWAELLRPGAPLLVAFFTAETEQEHGIQFDHKVTPSHRLFPLVIKSQLLEAGFARVCVHYRAHLETERPINHATILAERESS